MGAVCGSERDVCLPPPHCRTAAPVASTPALDPGCVLHGTPPASVQHPLPPPHGSGRGVCSAAPHQRSNPSHPPLPHGGTEMGRDGTDTKQRPPRAPRRTKGVGTAAQRAALRHKGRGHCGTRPAPVPLPVHMHVDLRMCPMMPRLGPVPRGPSVHCSAGPCAVASPQEKALPRPARRAAPCVWAPPPMLRTRLSTGGTATPRDCVCAGTPQNERSTRAAGTDGSGKAGGTVQRTRSRRAGAAMRTTGTTSVGATALYGSRATGSAMGITTTRSRSRTIACMTGPPHGPMVCALMQKGAPNEVGRASTMQAPLQSGCVGSMWTWCTVDTVCRT